MQRAQSVGPVLPAAPKQPIQKAFVNENEHTKPKAGSYFSSISYISVSIFSSFQLILRTVTPVDHKAHAYPVFNIKKFNLGLVALKPTTKSLVNDAVTRLSPAFHSVNRQGPRKAVSAVKSPSALDSVAMKESNIP